MGLFGFGKKTCGVCGKAYRGKTYQAKDGGFCPACYEGLRMRVTGNEWKGMECRELKDLLSRGIFSTTPITRVQKPNACMICGRELSMWPWEVKDGFLCDSCYEKASRCLKGKAEDLTIEEIQVGLKDYEKRKDQTDCAFCHGKIDGETDMALGDNQLICGQCIEKVRILCPVKVTYEMTEDHDYGMFLPPSPNGRKVTYDPLEEMTFDQYCELRREADEKRKKIQEKVPEASLVVEVEDLARWSPDIQYNERKNKKETVYQVLGRVYLGTLKGGETLLVDRGGERRSLKPFRILPYDGAVRSAGDAIPLDRVELEGPNTARSVGEGVLLLFKQEPSFLYPGDLLWMK